jgi:hypothetical protein
LRETGPRDFEEDVFLAAHVWVQARADASDLFHGALRVHVLRPHAEEHRADKLPSVVRQELLCFISRF